jgi:hypothetical protein
MRIASAKVESLVWKTPLKLLSPGYLRPQSTYVPARCANTATWGNSALEHHKSIKDGHASKASTLSSLPHLLSPMTSLIVDNDLGQQLIAKDAN